MGKTVKKTTEIQINITQKTYRRRGLVDVVMRG